MKEKHDIIYRIYGKAYNKGYVLVDTTPYEETIPLYIDRLSPNEFYGYMVIGRITALHMDVCHSYGFIDKPKVKVKK